MMKTMKMTTVLLCRSQLYRVVIDERSVSVCSSLLAVGLDLPLLVKPISHLHMIKKSSSTISRVVNVISRHQLILVRMRMRVRMKTSKTLHMNTWHYYTIMQMNDDI